VTAAAAALTPAAALATTAAAPATAAVAAVASAAAATQCPPAMARPPGHRALGGSLLLLLLPPPLLPPPLLPLHSLPLPLPLPLPPLPASSLWLAPQASGGARGLPRPSGIRSACFRVPAWEGPWGRARVLLLLVQRQGQPAQPLAWWRTAPPRGCLLRPRWQARRPLSAPHRPASLRQRLSGECLKPGVPASAPSPGAAGCGKRLRGGTGAAHKQWERAQSAPSVMAALWLLHRQ
jgi:hypothetical protein